MTGEILISKAHGQTRVAVLERGEVCEIYVENDADRGVAGNIYKGKVTRVLPGMQAAFVDIGLDRAAFLYVDDIIFEPGPDAVDANRPSIEKLISSGQEILVQVDKEPIGTKGARVTNYITIPGRFVVYVPAMRKIGVSRKITDEAERERLKTVLESLQQDHDGGLIARTICYGLEAEALAPDVAFSRSVSQEAAKKAKKSPTPALVLEDIDVALRAVRDLMTANVARVLVDRPEEVTRIRGLLDRIAPSLSDRVELCDPNVPLFEQFGVDRQIEKALLRKITLKSGVSVVFDEAEALTAVDINTGRFVGSRSLEATILEANLEAAVAIAKQIRLRNLGGIIIVDFIDMQDPESQKQVYEVFHDQVSHDRAKTQVLQMTGLGLIQMTRQRTRSSLSRIMTEACPYCEGRGRVRARDSVVIEILREVGRQARLHPDRALLVSAMPEVASSLADDHEGRLSKLEAEIGQSVVVEAREELHQEVFQVSVRPATVGPES